MYARFFAWRRIRHITVSRSNLEGGWSRRVKTPPSNRVECFRQKLDDDDDEHIIANLRDLIFFNKVCRRDKCSVFTVRRLKTTFEKRRCSGKQVIIIIIFCFCRLTRTFYRDVRITIEKTTSRYWPSLTPSLYLNSYFRKQLNISNNS